MAHRANIFVAFSSTQLYPAQRAGILSKTNLYSGPLGRKRLNIHHSTKILALWAMGHNLG